MSEGERIYLSPPHMGGSERRYLDEAFASNFVAPVGPQLDAFEESFLEKTGFAAAVAVASGILAFICIGFLVAPVGGIFLLVLAIMGLIKAVNGESVPVPLIGKWGEQWFEGITKV